MNTFFVSVERLKDPGLEGLPVVVGGPPKDRSVVSSASYEARRYGLHSAMPMTQAVRRCPELVIVPPHFKDYQHYHERVKAILQDFTPALEMTSIDEGYLDLTGTERLWGPPAETGRRIRQRILDETRLPASIGISANKLVSKVASDEAKPVRDPRLDEGVVQSQHRCPARVSGRHHSHITSEGVLVVPPGQEAAFLAPLPITHLPGCGQVTSAKLQARGIQTIGDLAAWPEEQLVAFGEVGHMLHQRANGIGSTKLGSAPQRKSISKERTFREDVTDSARLRSTLHQQAEEVGATLRRHREHARTVTIKLRYAGFETHTFSHTLAQPTNLNNDIYNEAVKLFTTHRQRGRPVRLIGVGISGLMAGLVQEDLFAQAEKAHNLRRDTVVDEIRERFGKDSLVTGERVFPAKGRK